MTSSQTSAPHRIVVGIDGSDSSMKALQWAARQAEMTGASLEIIATWEWPTTYGWTLSLPADYNPSSDAQRVVDQAAASVRQDHPHLGIHTRVAEGHPTPILIHTSRGADLLVVGSRGHGEFAGMLLGSVSEHCVTNAHCPVVVLRGEKK